ncbi:MAG: AI-2E family transporter [Candidatus Cloacimonetes bacterium]|nr:AI-2E family transporter [Candidatus Cloacimonadota bacterium]
MIAANKELRWIRLLLTIIAIPIVVIILKTLKAIFVPLILAVFFTFLFAPLTSFLKKKRVPLILILLITLVIIAAFFYLSVLLMYAASNSIITGLPNYQERFQQMVFDGTAMFTEMLSRMELMNENIPLLDFAQILDGGSISIPKVIANTMNVIMDIGWNLFLILVFMIFMLLEAKKLHARLHNALSADSKGQTFDTLQSIQAQIQRYITVKAMISLATAIVGMILMLIFGVDFVLVCGILLFVLNFIPNIGSIIASAIPIIICLLQGGFQFRVVVFSGLIIATQMFFGNILEPKFQAKHQNLTPIMVLISLIFWGWLWGIVGMLICVPLTSAINIILKQIDPENLISAIISDA